MEHSSRVVVTGLGAVAPNGSDTESFWKATVNGVSGIRRIESFDVSDYPCKIGGEVRAFNPGDFMSPKMLRRTGRTVHLAVAAVRLGLRHSGLDNADLDSDGAVVFFGAGCPAIDTIAADVDRFRQEGPRGLEPFRLSAEDTNSIAAAVREAVGGSDLAMVVASGCTAGLHAVALASERIRMGQSNVAICGSADAPLSPFSYAVFSASGMMSKRNSDPERASRPFDLKRDGGVLSEGAGALILESLEHALKRGATIYGEVVGFGGVTERPRNHGELPSTVAKEAFARSMMGALSTAHISPGDVDYISAHAPSDQECDRVETEAIKAVFGEWARRVPISSIKSCIGNPISAAGALQAIAALLAMRDGKIPPTINYEYPDSACDLDYVPNSCRYNQVTIALINSHGMGGSYASLVLRKWENGGV